MPEQKDLQRQEAIAKLKELAEKIDFCMFCTNLRQQPFECRPMSTREVDEEGNIWFLSRYSSNKNQEVKEQHTVQLIYSSPADFEFMTVYGQATVLRDLRKIDEVWSSFAKAWFNEGKNDPEVTLIKVVPDIVHYWDTKNGKFVTLLKTGISALIGKELETGVEGDLHTK